MPQTCQVSAENCHTYFMDDAYDDGDPSKKVAVEVSIICGR